MVISNSQKQHPGMMDGKILKERERPAGIIFFNEEQDEVGGLIYGGNETIGNNIVLSYDQYKNDQVMQLRHLTSRSGNNSYGLQLWDREEKISLPRLFHLHDSLKQLNINSYSEREQIITQMNSGEPLRAPRLFLGKKYNKEAGLFIQDEFGIDRLRIYVDTLNKPQIEILDKEGVVLKNLLGE